MSTDGVNGSAAAAWHKVLTLDSMHQQIKRWNMQSGGPSCREPRRLRGSCNRMKLLYLLIFTCLSGILSIGCGAADNVALNGTVTQSDTSHSGEASQAIDGNANMDWAGNSCMHTPRQNEPSWRVDLKDKYHVSAVIITNTADCCLEQLSGAEIRIGNSLENNGNSNPLCETINPSLDIKTLSFDCKRMEGQFVNIFIPGSGKLLTLCEVEVRGSKERVYEDNVALKGTATQSDTSHSAGAARAIDGKADTQWGGKSCTHTPIQNDPWWRVDLKDKYHVSAVIITNRADCCSERLSGAEIRIGSSLENNGNSNPLCGTIGSSLDIKTFSFDCKRMMGQYVNIVIPGSGKFLTLCEVEVYGSKERRYEDNVALKGTATQSDTSHSACASRAIDGNADTQWAGNSCTHTPIQNDPWWRVDLEDTYRVSTVNITNRADCCSERLSGAEIHIGSSLENNGNCNPLCGTIGSSLDIKTFSFDCKDMMGQYVNIIIPGSGKLLTLCEVEVYGSKERRYEDNVALKGTATQSDTSHSACASRAIDGNADTQWAGNSCTHTPIQNDPWWRVDLKDTYRVSTVNITNRADCCSERLSGAEIHIGSSLENNGNSNPLCGTIGSSLDIKTFSFDCKGMMGQYVNIIIPGSGKFLTLCEVEVYGSKERRYEDNVALKGTATQSDTSHSACASRAIDGNADTQWAGNSCTHTPIQNDPWWRVDLKDTYRVSVVNITNRADCCSERLSGAEIHIGSSLENNGNSNPLCGTIGSSLDIKTFSFDCKGMMGQYVNIIIPGSGKFLTLCEVEVYGSKERRYEDNVALKGTATQSDTSHSACASRAIDGNADTQWAGNSCTHTPIQNDPWWRVDLKDTYRVSTVNITNRADCCSERLSGAEIHIGSSLENNGNSNPLCGTIGSSLDIKTFSFDCKDMMGQYVNIIIPGSGKLLTLCEVEVYGSKERRYEDNVALKGIATQSDTSHSAGASRAIDGNADTQWAGNSCTHTPIQNDPWWRVDLKDTYRVSTVNITNRADCCSERLSGAEIHIGSSLENNGNSNPLCGTINSSFDTTTLSFDCKGMVGQYVNIIIPGSGKSLTLCEVEVYGSKERRYEDNVALKGTATQSDTSHSAGASRAIDSNADTQWAGKSCTHTPIQDDPWWRVDLKDTYRVSTVIITNRADCCSERLSGAEIHIGSSLENNGNSNPLCGTIGLSLDIKPLSFDCKGTVGQYVNIIIPGRGKILTLCEVEVYGSKERRYEDNVALKGTATQSDTSHSAGASRAIDGNADTQWAGKSCTHTPIQNDPWWRVDLKDTYRVSTVNITNRADCCSERLSGAEIHIGSSLENNGNSNPLCGTIGSSLDIRTFSFDCKGMEGQYVNIIIPGSGKLLTLCEVEVSGSKERRYEDNVALKGTATQSDTSHSAGASRAIDGNADTQWAGNSCTHTPIQNDPWWRVDLKDTYRVSTVNITNRADCCSERLSGAEIRIGSSLENNGNSNPLCGTINSSLDITTLSFDCKGMAGQYVNIIIPGSGKSLTLCEVEVYGSKERRYEDNVALKGTATQSDTSHSAGASRAIDGNADTQWAGKSCTHTPIQNDPWWRVDLKDTYRVSTVNITNRADCCSERLSGAEIHIGSSLENNGNCNPLCGTIGSTLDIETLSFDCDGMEGQYVNIIIPGSGKVLTLCEVEVYGSKDQ
uniref:uncharacterized protein isoform X2 n=1 Tax=Pristiophorus japonicus TaxID=55135 RepID=UPI00398EB92A